MKILGQIERIAPPSPADFSTRFVQRELPVVLAGGAAGWRATATWSAATLAARLQEVPIAYKQSPSHRHPDFHQTDLARTFARGQSTFGELMDAITTGPRAERARRLFTGDEQFLMRRRDGAIAINPDLKPLLDDVEIPRFLPEDRLYTVWAWFSGPGVRTWLHYDNNGCHNLNAQLTGGKRCLLFPPSELERLHLFPPGGPNPAHNCSQIDVDAPDLERFPDFAAAGALEATIEAGDLLFIPAWWLHAFVHLGDFNSNVNFWWKPTEALAPNPVATRQAALDAALSAGTARTG